MIYLNTSGISHSHFHGRSGTNWWQREPLVRGMTIGHRNLASGCPGIKDWMVQPKMPSPATTGAGRQPAPFGKRR